VRLLNIKIDPLSDFIFNSFRSSSHSRGVFEEVNVFWRQGHVFLLHEVNVHDTGAGAG